MAPTAASVLLQHEGSLPGGESFSFGIWMAGDGTLITQSQLNSLVADAATAAGTWWGSTAMGQVVGQGANLVRIVGYSYPSPPLPATLRAEAPYSGAQSATVATKPNQVALVVSLKSSVPQARASGRFYLPALAATVANGVMTASQATGVAGVTAAYLTALNASSATSDVVVAGSAGVPVVRVVVDNVLDTQRRRRKSVRPTINATATVS